MKRRGFLGALIAAPVAFVAARTFALPRAASPINQLTHLARKHAIKPIRYQGQEHYVAFLSPEIIKHCGLHKRQMFEGVRIYVGGVA